MATPYDDDEAFIDDDDYQPEAPVELTAEEHALEAQRAEEKAQIARENLVVLESVPDPVKKFVLRLHQALSAQNLPEIATLYEKVYNSLSNEFFKSEEWPRAEVVSSLVRDDEVFLTFYRELYFRHLYSRFAANLDVDDRFDSYENYCNLFNYILSKYSDGPVPVELPNSWLWDIIDEFLWQFGSFAAWRSKTKDKAQDEINLLEESPQVWSCYSVLNVLYSLIQKSRIQDQLKAAKDGVEFEADEYASRPLYRMLGYFSILGLLRVHVVLGDYSLALSSLDDIDIKGMVNPATRMHAVHSAHTAVFYYIGFSYLMLGRYADAIDMLSRGISHFYKNRRFTAGADQVAKTVERMLALVAIAHTFTPNVKLEDWVKQGVNEKFGDAYTRISRTSSTTATQQEVLETYEDLYTRACPKFLSPSPPPFESNGESSAQIIDPLRHQVNIFLSSVKHQYVVPDMRSFLRLYSTLSTAKLASLLNRDEQEVVEELSLVKRSSVTLRWQKGPLLSGSPETVSDIAFSIDNDIVTITEAKKQRQVADYFLRRSNKAAEQLAQLKAKPLPIAAQKPSHYSNQAKPANVSISGETSTQKSVAWSALGAARA